MGDRRPPLTDRGTPHQLSIDNCQLTIANSPDGAVRRPARFRRTAQEWVLAATAFLTFAAAASPARAELEVRVSTSSAGQYQPVEVTACDPDGATASHSA